MRRSWAPGTAILAGAVCAAALAAPASAAATTTPHRGAAPAAPTTRASVPAAARPAPRCPLPVYGPGRTYRPRIDPRSFSAAVTNPWFPLVPGRTSVYAGTKDGKRALNVVVVTRHTKRIGGVPTRVVEDRLYLDGVLGERTRDYYAQDRCGNVWYFGEDTATLDARGGVTSTEGTFHAGVGGARPGVVMAASPRIGRWFRQEWSPGQAEDRFRVVDLSAAIAVPYGRFAHALRTEERTSLEPSVVDAKYYVRGVGEVFEGAVKGPREALRLVEVIS